MATIRPLSNQIIFQFVDTLVLKDGLHKKQFKDVTDWGFEISTPSQSMDNPRWGIITHIGPDIDDLFVGDKVLVTALKWTVAFSFEGQDYWNTNDEQILAFDDEITIKSPDMAYFRGKQRNALGLQPA